MKTENTWEAGHAACVADLTSQLELARAYADPELSRRAAADPAHALYWREIALTLVGALQSLKRLQGPT